MLTFTHARHFKHMQRQTLPRVMALCSDAQPPCHGPCQPLRKAEHNRSAGRSRASTHTTLGQLPRRCRGMQAVSTAQLGHTTAVIARFVCCLGGKGGEMTTSRRRRGRRRGAGCGSTDGDVDVNGGSAGWARVMCCLRHAQGIEGSRQTQVSGLGGISLQLYKHRTSHGARQLSWKMWSQARVVAD